MKTTHAQHESGNILMTSLVITAVAGFTLASFLTMISSQSRSIVRSQYWNMTMPILEAGLEEAMAHLNHNVFIDDLNRQNQTPQWTADGWTTSSDGYGVQKKTTLPDGSWYNVVIHNSGPSGATPKRPQVFSEGHVAHSDTVQIAPETMFAVIGDNVSVSNVISRKVRVTTYNPALFANGMVGKDGLDMKGGNVYTDSFDSSDPNYSTNGFYLYGRSKDNGDVAAGGAGISNAVVNVGNANIRGHVATSPGGQINIGATGKIGDKNFQLNGNGQIQDPSWTNNDLNVSFPDVKAPDLGTYSTSVSGGSVSITNVSAVNTTNTVLFYPVGESNITTNYSTQTSMSYPASGSYFGPVTTNTAEITDGPWPASGTYIGAVWTNLNLVSAIGYPSPGTYVGNVTSNAGPRMTTPTLPGTGDYYGNITTNIAITNSLTYPPKGTYIGQVTTNAGPWVTNSAPLPSGYYYRLEDLITEKHKWDPVWPGYGRVDGAISTNYAGGSSNTKTYDYYLITSWIYSLKKYYYDQIASYSWNSIVYNYQKVTGYNYTKITGYSYAVINSYSYLSQTNVTNVTGTVTYDFILDSGNYKLTSLAGKGLVRGQVVAMVTEDIDLGEISFAPGSCLKLYCAAPSVQISGNDAANRPGYATNFFFYGLPSCTDVSITGNGGFTGCIYAPNAELHLGGGGNDVMDFVGAAVFKKVKLNGHMNFHYDEALRKFGPSRGYVVESWREVSVNNSSP